jgi:hypothetical protein
MAAEDWGGDEIIMPQPFLPASANRHYEYALRAYPFDVNKNSRWNCLSTNMAGSTHCRSMRRPILNG